MARQADNGKMAIILQYVALGCMITTMAAAAAHLFKGLLAKEKHHER